MSREWIIQDQTRDPDEQQLKSISRKETTQRTGKRRPKGCPPIRIEPASQSVGGPPGLSGWPTSGYNWSCNGDYSSHESLKLLRMGSGTVGMVGHRCDARCSTLISSVLYCAVPFSAKQLGPYRSIMSGTTLLYQTALDKAVTQISPSPIRYLLRYEMYCFRDHPPAPLRFWYSRSPPTARLLTTPRGRSGKSGRLSSLRFCEKPCSDMSRNRQAR